MNAPAKTRNDVGTPSLHPLPSQGCVCQTARTERCVTALRGGRLSHPYVIRTYGACTDDGTLLILVMEVSQTLPRDRTLSHLCDRNPISTLSPLPLPPLLAAGGWRHAARTDQDTECDADRPRAHKLRPAAGCWHVLPPLPRGAFVGPVRPESQWGCLAGREPSAVTLLLIDQEGEGARL